MRYISLSLLVLVIDRAVLFYFIKTYLCHICFFIFDLVTGPFQADWLWRDGRVRTSEGASLLRHYLLEWPTHTDTSKAYPLPASHVWGWWGLLRKRKIFQYSAGLSVLIHSLLKCDALLKDSPTLWSKHKSSSNHHYTYLSSSCILSQYDDLLSQFSNMQVAQSSSSHSLSPHESTPPQRSSSNIEQYIHDLDNNSFELDLQFTEEEKQLLLDKQTTGNPW